MDRSWQAKVTAIYESKDLTTLTMTSLFGKLRELELEMNRLNDQEHEEKHVRRISLRVVGHKDGQDSSEGSDGETLNLLTRKFSKFLKKNNREKNESSNKYNSKKVNELNSTNYTCFGCGKQGHIKADCPNIESKRQARRLKGRAKQEEPTLLGKIMMIPPLAHHQRKMKKSICV